VDSNATSPGLNVSFVDSNATSLELNTNNVSFVDSNATSLELNTNNVSFVEQILNSSFVNVTQGVIASNEIADNVENENTTSSVLLKTLIVVISTLGVLYFVRKGIKKQKVSELPKYLNE
jgi:hypothetical protein